MYYVEIDHRRYFLRPYMEENSCCQTWATYEKSLRTKLVFGPPLLTCARYKKSLRLLFVKGAMTDVMQLIWSKSIQWIRRYKRITVAKIGFWPTPPSQYLSSIQKVFKDNLHLETHYLCEYEDPTPNSYRGVP